MTHLIQIKSGIIHFVVYQFVWISWFIRFTELDHHIDTTSHGHTRLYKILGLSSELVPSG